MSEENIKLPNQEPLTEEQTKDESIEVIDVDQPIDSQSQEEA